MELRVAHGLSGRLTAITKSSSQLPNIDLNVFLVTAFFGPFRNMGAWQSNAATQIRWGLGYINSLYGSRCGAWSHEQSSGWY